LSREEEKFGRFSIRRILGFRELPANGKRKPLLEALSQPALGCLLNIGGNCSHFEAKPGK
jgi:hypothetical protein